jgi:xylose isomerase
MMVELKVSAGVWYLGATSDRFVVESYRPDRTMEERFKLAASIEGVGGLEMHDPTEVTDDTYKSLKALADDLGLKIVQFCPHLWTDPRFKFGQFSNPDPKLRRAAIDLAKRTMDIASYMEAEIMVYWPAQDGYDYPFQADHRKRLDDLVEGLAEWADYAPQQKVVIE